MTYRHLKGSIGYDYENLPYDEFINKYYSGIPIDWNRVMSIINLGFNKDTESEFIRSLPFKDGVFDLNKMISFYRGIYDDKSLADDIKRMISFMAGSGYFDKLGGIAFEAWKSQPDIDNPILIGEENDKTRSINDLLSLENGMNAVRHKVLSSKFWKNK